MEQKEKRGNPVFEFLEQIFNLMLANVLFLVCSLPVVTLGAAAAGLIQVAQDQLYGEGEPVIRRFFRSFRRNFRQATGAWLLLAVFLGGMVCNALLVLTYLRGWMAQIGYLLVGILAAVGMAIASYLFPMIVRYQNPLRVHLNNSLILAVVKLPRTILLVLLNTALFGLLFFSMKVFVSTMIFWVILGFGFIAYSDERILRPVFREMEETDTVELLKTRK